MKSADISAVTSCGQSFAGLLYGSNFMWMTLNHVIAAVSDPSGPFRGISAPGVAAWAAGAIAYFVAGSIGGTLPAFALPILVYLGLRRTISATPP